MLVGLFGDEVPNGGIEQDLRGPGLASRKGGRAADANCSHTYVNQVRGGTLAGMVSISTPVIPGTVSTLTGRLFHTRLLKIPAIPRGTAGVLVNMETAILSLISHDPWVRNFGRHPEPTPELVKHSEQASFSGLTSTHSRRTH